MGETLPDPCLRAAGPHGNAGDVHTAEGFTEQVFTGAVDNHPRRAEILVLFTWLQLPAERDRGAAGTRSTGRAQPAQGEVSASKMRHTLLVGH